jgi:hypothetical protein
LVQQKEDLLSIGAALMTPPRAGYDGGDGAAAHLVVPEAIELIS